MGAETSGTKPLRIRKSLAGLKVTDKLNGTDERKGYFYCLKLLGVLPPPPDSGFQKWVFLTPVAQTENQVYTPKCLHDILIASHSTTCEHSSLYFGYYHRHLMVLTEIFLNFAHQVLREGYKKLKSVYSGSQLEQLYNDKNKLLWDNVFKEYQYMKGIPDQIANHYWNPTNYLNDQDMKVLEELAPKDKSDDAMDLLYFNINKSYPWQINVSRRWYQSGGFNIQDIAHFFSYQDVILTSDQRDFLNGNLDPRKKSKVYGQDMHFLQTDYGGWINNNSNMVNYRNYLPFQKNSNHHNYGLNSIRDNEALSNYGAKSKNLQYITQQEANQNNLTSQYYKNYNMHVPHYQYAEAFFEADVKQFFYQSQIQTCHNTMHNNFQIIMKHPAYSITSLIFFPYHSWIDCGIQLYIRKTNSQGVGSFNSISNLLNNFQNPLPGVLQDVISKASQFTSKQLQWQINGASLDGNKAGAYPICEYINPQFKLFQQIQDNLNVLEASFCARDYILTKQNMRDSLHFNEIYQEYYIDQLNRDRFYFLQIKDYNFDYNYQVEVETGVWQQLDINATNLPKYLKDMENIWKKNRQIKNDAVKAAAQKSANPIITKLQSPQIQVNSVQPKIQIEPKLLQLGSPKERSDIQPHKQGELKQVKSGLPEELDSVGQKQTEGPVEERQKIRKLFSNGLYLFASYAPDTKNGTNLIFLNLKKAFEKLKSTFNSKELQGSNSQKRLVGIIQIFGKENVSKNCPKCQNYKIYQLDLDENLRVRLPKIWQFIHLEALNKLLYDSQNLQNKINCVSQNVSLVPNEKFKDYRLIYGAEEIEVQLIDHTTSNESQYIRLDAQSYSVSKNVISNVLSKKFYTFMSRFDFYKNFDVFNKNENNYFDSYVYKKLKGTISVGSKKIEFSISFQCYQRLLRLHIQISGNSNNLRVIVYDADYDAKKEFYNKAI